MVPTGGIVGEIGVLCDMAQVFTVRTLRLSQILRLNRHILSYASIKDATIIMENFLQVYRVFIDTFYCSLA